MHIYSTFFSVTSKSYCNKNSLKQKHTLVPTVDVLLVLHKNMMQGNFLYMYLCVCRVAQKSRSIGNFFVK